MPFPGTHRRATKKGFMKRGNHQTPYRFALGAFAFLAAGLLLPSLAHACGSVNLTIVKTGPPSASPNNLVIYNVTVSQSGIGHANNVVVFDQVPAGLTFSATGSSSHCVLVGSQVQCTSPHPLGLSEGDDGEDSEPSVTFPIAFLVPGSPAQCVIQNVARVVSAETPQEEASNTVTTPIVCVTPTPTTTPIPTANPFPTFAPSSSQVVSPGTSPSPQISSTAPLTQAPQPVANTYSNVPQPRQMLDQTGTTQLGFAPSGQNTQELEQLRQEVAQLRQQLQQNQNRTPTPTPVPTPQKIIGAVPSASAPQYTTIR